MNAPQIVNMFQTEDGKMGLHWGIPELLFHGIVVAISQNPEFAEADRRIFVLPPITACTLDCGKGLWYVRIGGCEGSKELGKVVWSGLYGPIPIQSYKNPPAQKEHSIRVVHTQQLQDGFRVNTDNSIGNGFFVERCEARDGGPKFPVGTTKWFYTFDRGLGMVDCKGMAYPTQYSIRISSFPMPVTKNPAYPWHDTFPTQEIMQVTKGIVYNNKTAAKVQPRHIRITNAVDSMVVDQRKANPNMRFASHADYVRYIGAKERLSDSKQ
jgi:hypothetical protein